MKFSSTGRETTPCESIIFDFDWPYIIKREVVVNGIPQGYCVYVHLFKIYLTMKYEEIQEHSFRQIPKLHAACLNCHDPWLCPPAVQTGCPCGSVYRRKASIFMRKTLRVRPRDHQCVRIGRLAGKDLRFSMKMMLATVLDTALKPV